MCATLRRRSLPETQEFRNPEEARCDQVASFGLPVFTFRPDPNIEREYDVEYTASIQHEIVRGLSVSAGYYRRGTYDFRRTENVQFAPSDYTIVNVVSPLDGQALPVYNLDPTKRLLTNRVDYNSTDSDLRRRTYNGLQFGFNARVAGAQFFVGGPSIASSTSTATRSRATSFVIPTMALPRSRRTTFPRPTTTSATRASWTCRSCTS